MFIFSLVLYFFTLFVRFFMLKEGYEINVFTFTRIDQLVLGCILALLERNGYLTSKYLRFYGSILILGFVLVAVVNTFDYFYLNLFKHNAFGILYFGLIGWVIVSSENMLFNKFLTLRSVQYLGKISYGIYVWHILVIDFLNHYVKTGIVLLDFLIVSLATILIATISYQYLEKPFLNFKKYFAYA